MMASITFRLRSSNHVGAIDMDGKVISVREVQAAVAEKLKAPEEEIRVFIADSTDLLHPDEELLAYSVVDVVRQSHTGKLTYATSKARMAANDFASNSAGPNASALPGVGNANAAPLTEEERLAQLQAEVTLDTGIDQVNSRFRRGGGPGGRGGGGRGGGGPGGEGGRGGGGPGGFSGFNPMDAENFRAPPKGYICHNCGKSGHYIHHCPAVKANGGKHMRVLSLPIGIPESMLVECSMDDPAPKFITRDHRLVKRKMDSAAFASIVMPTEPSTSPQPEGSGTARDAVGPGSAASAASEASAAVPARLRCIVDKVPAGEALRTECCERLICKSCHDSLVQDALRRMEDPDAAPLQCPACEEPLMIDDFSPAVEERKEIADLLAARKRPRS